MPNQPEYVTALQNATNAYLSGLQNREAREQREKERADASEQQRKNFLLNLRAQQMQAGDVGAARLLDTEFGQTPQVPEGFGALLAKRGEAANPQVLNDAQRKLMGSVNAMQGLPGGASSSSFTPDESQSLQQGQQAFEQQNLAGLTGLSQGKSLPAFMGAFEQFTQQQQVKQQQELERKQVETKRAQDEKYFEDVDKAVLDGRVSPTNATKYFQAKRDYVSGKTTELPTVDLREKPTSDSGADSRLETARNRKSNTILMALSRVDDDIQDVERSIGEENKQWGVFQQNNADPRLLDAAGSAFIERTKKLRDRQKGLEKRRGDFNKILETLMKEEGLNVPEGFAEEPKISEKEQNQQRIKQAALQLYQTLLKTGQSADYARNEAVRRFSYDPTQDYMDIGSPLPMLPNTSTPEAAANQALQATEPAGAGQSREDRTKAFLENYRDADNPNGFESDETAIRLFLQNNPNF